MGRLIIRAWVAGFLGTTAFALVAYSFYPLATGGVPLDLAGMLGGPLDENWLAGLIALFVLGTLVAPAVYVVLLRRVLPGHEPLRGMVWGSLMWVAVQISVGPLGDGGWFSRGAGGLPVAIGLLVGLLIYGAVFGVMMRETHPAHPAGTMEETPAHDAVEHRRAS